MSGIDRIILLSGAATGPLVAQFLHGQNSEADVLHVITAADRD
jgi:hypothetical protein